MRQSFGQTIRTGRQSFGRIEALVIVAYDISFNQLCFNFEQGFKSSVSVTNLIHVSANHTTSGNSSLDRRTMVFLVILNLSGSDFTHLLASSEQEALGHLGLGRTMDSRICSR